MDDFYNSQPTHHKVVLTEIFRFVEEEKYEGMKLRTTEYRKNRLSRFLNELDGTLMVDLLCYDIRKLV